MDRHTESLLPEICQKERHGSIILQLLNMINRSFAYIKYDKAVPFFLHISGNNISVCRCSIIRGILEKNLFFQVKYLTSYSRKRICQNRLPKCE